MGPPPTYQLDELVTTMVGVTLTYNAERKKQSRGAEQQDRGKKKEMNEMELGFHP